MRLMIALFTLASASFPVSATYGTKDGCRTFDGHSVTAGLVLAPDMLITSEAACGEVETTPTGYLAHCPNSGPETIAFTVTQKGDAIVYDDDYWGTEVLHRCP